MARDVGRPRNLNDPQELLDLWDQYKAWIDSKPDTEQVVTQKGDIVIKETKRPYLRQGFIAFVYRKRKFSVTDYLSGLYEEFSEVVETIRQEWEEDQVSGTLTGKYKAQTLVARLNGYAEKTDNKNENTNIEIKAEFGVKKDG